VPAAESSLQLQVGALVRALLSTAHEHCCSSVEGGVSGAPLSFSLQAGQAGEFY